MAETIAYSAEETQSVIDRTLENSDWQPFQGFLSETLQAWRLEFPGSDRGMEGGK